MTHRLIYLVLAIWLAFGGVHAASAAPSVDIVFVTQVPHPQDFTTIASTFGNHLGSLEAVTRGGDLYIRYSDGTLKNLTRAAGYGMDSFQGAQAIAVRDPAVHWEGQRIIFSMVVGAPTERYEYADYYWQLYEISGFEKGATPVITKVSNQPTSYNNVMPIYGTDDRIIFVSDRPRNGASHLYPQRDEYESAPTNTGIWSLEPQSGDLDLLDHAPSGDFNPIIDSFGRILFTRWDHLQRDQQAGGLTEYGAFNYTSEDEEAAHIDSQEEVFPEPRDERERVVDTLNLHSFNHFFPWMMNEDGTELETLNHIGRHELHGYFDRSFNDDSNLEEHYLISGNSEIQNFFQIREDPNNPGLYYGIDAPEFRTHAAGQIVSLSGAPTLPTNEMVITYITHRDTASYTDTPASTHSGLYRNPTPLSDGSLIATHTSETREEENIGTTTAPRSRYDFRIKTLKRIGGYWVSDQALTSGIEKSLSFYSPDELVSYSGTLWELQPIEVRMRERPAKRAAVVEEPEQQMFSETAVEIDSFKQYLIENDLALIVMRNVTTRDANDKQQPFNLRVAGTTTKSTGTSGKLYDISNLQIFQGDQVRGYTTFLYPSPGRRVLAQTLHDTEGINPVNSSGPAGSVSIAEDGSVAAFVPARRALTWQLTDASGAGVVRERYWLTFQPGEIRLCTSCHGINDKDQKGDGTPQNAPEALKSLLAYWSSNPISISPKYTLKLTSGKKMKGGSKTTIMIKGENAAAARKSLNLRLSVNGESCPSPIATFTTDPDGNHSLKGTAPNAKARLTFELMQGDSLKKALSAALKPKKGIKIKAKKVVTSVCRRFATFK